MWILPKILQNPIINKFLSLDGPRHITEEYQYYSSLQSDTSRSD